MFVSSLASESKSLSFRLVPLGVGDFCFDELDMRESAGETRPLLGCAVVRVRVEEGRGGGGGRMVFRFPGTALGRCMTDAMATCTRAIRDSPVV